jgi:adenylosuccinate synthase
MDYIGLQIVLSINMEKIVYIDIFVNTKSKTCRVPRKNPRIQDVQDRQNVREQLPRIQNVQNVQINPQDIVNQNKLLNVVKNDYSRYKNYIMEQQNTQSKTMNVLDKCVKEIPKDIQYQRNLLQEIGNIRKSIDDIINKN